MLGHIHDCITQFDEVVIRAQFSGRMRKDFYRSMAILLKNNVLLHDALSQMYNIVSKDGLKPKVVQAVVLHDCIRTIKDGKTIAEALAKWVPYQEASLIEAGLRSGNIHKALEDTIKVLEGRQKMMGAVAMGAAYPTILVILLCIELNIVATKLVPTLSRISQPESWEGCAAALYMVSSFVTNWGRIALALLICLAVAVVLSLPRLRGSIRIYLDFIPPWSIYRMVYGATFLMNVSVMMASGIQLRDALQILSQRANPWLRERLDATYYGTGLGVNFGVALNRAGYHFPDRKAIQFLMILANLEGFEAAMANYADEWMQESIRKVQLISKMIFGVGLMTVFAVILLILLGSQGIQESVQASFH
jgi:type II secretory pathway component PulF